MKALIYSDNEQEYKDLKSVLEEELDGIIVKQILSDGHFHVEEDGELVIVAVNGAMGMEIMQSFRERHPDSRIIWITDDQYFGRVAIRCHIFDFMVRPYSGSRYREAVRRIAWETQYA
jgi:DNA-binding NtrC family response regulator